MRTPEWLAQVVARLACSGLDLARAFDASEYDAMARAHGGLRPLAAFVRPRPLALLVGNTRALWPHFLAAYRSDPALRAAPDPLDTWVAARVSDALASSPVASVLHLASDRGEHLVSMLRAAEASGLARTGPAHLAVHPEHGPWFGLRALVVFDADAHTATAPAPAAGGREAGAGRTARREAADDADPCRGCSAPCVVAMERAIAASASADGGAAWTAWLAVRDACPVGRDSRYSEDQILYHYTKRRSALGEVS